VIDCGGLGFLSTAAHGHADCLSLCICYRGEWLVVDPGTFCYHRDPLWRDHFRGTAAHSTITVDGSDQSQMLGPFLWGRQARPEPRLWGETGRFVLFEGAHNGYRGRRVQHSRRVLFGSRGYWIIVDRVEGSGRHRVGATFQLAPGLSATSNDSHEFTRQDGVGITVKHWLPEDMTSEVIEGRERPPGGWCSPGFGLRVPAPAVRVVGDVELPLTMVFALIPFAGERDIDVTFSGGPLSGGVSLSAKFPDGRDRCLLGPDVCESARSRFRGTLGFAAERDGGTEFFGMDVRQWTEEGADIEYEAVPNLVIGRGGGKE
jgi:hypothetical protein